MTLHFSQQQRQPLVVCRQQHRTTTTTTKQTPFNGKSLPSTSPLDALRPIVRRKAPTSSSRHSPQKAFGMTKVDYSIPPPLYRSPPPPPIKTPYLAIGTAVACCMGVAWFSIYGKNDALEMWEAMESGELFIEADDDDDDDDDE